MKNLQKLIRQQRKSQITKNINGIEYSLWIQGNKTNIKIKIWMKKANHIKI